MDSSIFLARLIGPLLVVIGVGLFVNRDNYRTLAREFLDSPALIYIAGIIAFLGGLTAHHHPSRLAHFDRRHHSHRLSASHGAAR